MPLPAPQASSCARCKRSTTRHACQSAMAGARAGLGAGDGMGVGSRLFPEPWWLASRQPKLGPALSGRTTRVGVRESTQKRASEHARAHIAPARQTKSRCARSRGDAQNEPSTALGLLELVDGRPAVCEGHERAISRCYSGEAPDLRSHAMSAHSTLSACRAYHYDLYN